MHTQVYKYCFGRPADGLERSVEGEDECGLKRGGEVVLTEADMITMNQPPLTQHISIPKDMSQLSCEAFTAGIVEGVLDGLDVVSGCHRGGSADFGSLTPRSHPGSQHTPSPRTSIPSGQ